MPATDALPAGQAESFDAITSLIERSQRIAVCAHTSPDGDALGSQLALIELIERTWPEKDVRGLLADDDVVPRIYQFLPGSRAPRSARVTTPRTLTSLSALTSSHPDRLNQAGRRSGALGEGRRARPPPVRGPPFWDAGVVRPSAAAAGVIVAEYALHLAGALTETMAQCLLCALVTDTGRFQYQNANGEAFRVASALVDAGASPSEVSLHVYQSDRVSYLHLSATVMGRITTFEQGRIA